jgi:hypothetical protein
VQDLLAARVHVIDLMFSNQNFRFQLILVAGAIAVASQNLIHAHGAGGSSVLRKSIRFGLEPRIVLRNLEETASTAEGFLHHAHRAELVTDPG